MNSIQKCAIAVGTEKIEFLMQSGFSEEGAKRSVSSHLHPNVEIHYISEGSFVFVTSKGERTVEKYTLVIIPPKHYHSFKACCPRVRRLSFEIRLSPDSRYASLFSSLTEPLAVNERISELDNVSDMMGVISGEEAICRINALFALSFLNICDILRKNRNSVPISSETTHTAHAQPADEENTLTGIINFITNRYRTPLTLSQVASEAGLSCRQVQRILSARMGQGFKEVLSRNRVTAVCDMINDPLCDTMTLEQIAFACGFSNYVSFWSVFKRLVGSSPEQYRASIKSGRR